MGKKRVLLHWKINTLHTCLIRIRFAWIIFLRMKYMSVRILNIERLRLLVRFSGSWIGFSFCREEKSAHSLYLSCLLTRCSSILFFPFSRSPDVVMSRFLWVSEPARWSIISQEIFEHNTAQRERKNSIWCAKPTSDALHPKCNLRTPLFRIFFFFLLFSSL